MARAPASASAARELAGGVAEAFRRPGLRRSLLVWAGAGLVLTETFTVAVTRMDRGAPMAALALAAGGWWLAVTAALAVGSVLLHTPDGRPLNAYGLPNGLTAIRAWLSFPLILCAVLPLPGVLNIALWGGVGGGTGLLDLADGYIARRFGPITALGKALDPAMDVLFFSMAGIGNWLLGIAPGWLGIFILVRYLGPFAATPVVLALGRRPELVHTTWGRRNTAAIGLVLLILLVVRIAGGPIDVVALALGLPLLVPTLLLHLIALGQRTAEAPQRSAPDRPTTIS